MHGSLLAAHRRIIEAAAIHGESATIPQNLDGGSVSRVTAGSERCCEWFAGGQAMRRNQEDSPMFCTRKGKKRAGNRHLWLFPARFSRSVGERVGYACSPLGATDVRPQSSHCR